MPFKFDLESIDRLPRLTEEQSRRLVKQCERDIKREEKSVFHIIVPSAEEQLHNGSGKQRINGLH